MFWTRLFTHIKVWSNFGVLNWIWYYNTRLYFLTQISFLLFVCLNNLIFRLKFLSIWSWAFSLYFFSWFDPLFPSFVFRCWILQSLRKRISLNWVIANGLPLIFARFTISKHSLSWIFYLRNDNLNLHFLKLSRNVGYRTTKRFSDKLLILPIFKFSIQKLSWNIIFFAHIYIMIFNLLLLSWIFTLLSLFSLPFLWYTIVIRFFCRCLGLTFYFFIVYNIKIRTLFFLVNLNSFL